MKKILVIKNGPIDTDIDFIIKAVDDTIIVDIIFSVSLTEKINEDILKKGEYIGIIILGGYHSLAGRTEKNYPHKYLNVLIDYVRGWIENKIHVLGICTGAQICGEAIGFETVKMVLPIIGYNKKIDVVNDDSFLNNDLQSMFKYMFSCHDDCITCHKTDNYDFKLIAVHDNIPYMFKINDTVYGAQFHPDFTLNVFNQIDDNYKTTLCKDFMENNENKILKTSVLFIKNWLETLNRV